MEAGQGAGLLSTGSLIGLASGLDQDQDQDQGIAKHRTGVIIEVEICRPVLSIQPRTPALVKVYM